MLFQTSSLRSNPSKKEKKTFGTLKEGNKLFVVRLVSDIVRGRGKVEMVDKVVYEPPCESVSNSLCGFVSTLIWLEFEDLRFHWVGPFK